MLLLEGKPRHGDILRCLLEPTRTGEGSAGPGVAPTEETGRRAGPPAPEAAWEPGVRATPAGGLAERLSLCPDSRAGPHGGSRPTCRRWSAGRRGPVFTPALTSVELPTWGPPAGAGARGALVLCSLSLGTSAGEGHSHGKTGARSGPGPRARSPVWPQGSAPRPELPVPSQEGQPGAGLGCSNKGTAGPTALAFSPCPQAGSGPASRAVWTPRGAGACALRLGSPAGPVILRKKDLG